MRVLTSILTPVKPSGLLRGSAVTCFLSPLRRGRAKGAGNVVASELVAVDHAHPAECARQQQPPRGLLEAPVDDVHHGR